MSLFRLSPLATQSVVNQAPPPPLMTADMATDFADGPAGSARGPVTAEPDDGSVSVASIASGNMAVDTALGVTVSAATADDAPSTAVTGPSGAPARDTGVAVDTAVGTAVGTFAADDAPAMGAGNVLDSGEAVAICRPTRLRWWNDRRYAATT